MDQQRWEVADDLYPLPLLGGVDPEVRRPPLEALTRGGPGTVHS